MNSRRELMMSYIGQVISLLNLEVDERQVEQLILFDEFLLNYNEKMNLTRIVDPLEVAVKHFADSLTVLSYFQLGRNSKVIDIGAGAGFPGIPLAIVRPDLNMTLLDSLRKRTVYLKELVEHLNLKNVKVVWGRAEDLGHDVDYRERHEVAVARAVAPLNVLAELCLPLIKVGGTFIALKGPKAETEVSNAETAFQLVGGQLISVIPVILPILDDHRCLVHVLKKTFTSRSYPRKAGIPERQPL